VYQTTIVPVSSKELTGAYSIFGITVRNKMATGL
jgi:hypothetical protein